MVACESCTEAASHTWRRIMPDYATLSLCEKCSTETRRRAADRGDDSEKGRLLRLVYALAGEVWVEGETNYWFREPLSVRKQPSAVPTWIPRIELTWPAPRQAPAAPKARAK